MSERFDAVVIGMGPGGEAVTTRLLQAGRSVAIVEHALIGGECGYWACIPSKVLLRPVELALQAAATPGVAVEPLDWPSVRAWRDEMVRHHDDSKQVADYEKQGATMVRGTARITGPGVVEVAGRRLTAEHVVVATGSSASLPDIEGLDQCTVWTNREATNFSDVPGQVVVIGAGPVALEVGQYLHGFGAQVVIVGRGPRVLSREEPRVSELAAQHLRARGIDLRLGAAPVRAFRDGADSVLQLDDGTTVRGDVLVLATGRRPRTSDLGLESLDVSLDERGALVVDEHCSAGSGLWGVGDVTDTGMFTHVAKYQARIATAAMLGRPRPARYDSVPRVVFGHPEIAAVGATEAAAVADGRRVRRSEVDLTAALARPWTYEAEPSGAALGLVADAETDLLLGAWAVAPQASEWIHQAAVAIGAEIPIDRLLDHIPQYPTYSEGYVEALERLARGGTS